MYNDYYDAIIIITAVTVYLAYLGMRHLMNTSKPDNTNTIITLNEKIDIVNIKTDIIHNNISNEIKTNYIKLLSETILNINSPDICTNHIMINMLVISLAAGSTLTFNTAYLKTSPTYIIYNINPMNAYNNITNITNIIRNISTIKYTSLVPLLKPTPLANLPPIPRYSYNTLNNNTIKLINKYKINSTILELNNSFRRLTPLILYNNVTLPKLTYTHDKSKLLNNIIILEKHVYNSNNNTIIFKYRYNRMACPCGNLLLTSANREEYIEALELFMKYYRNDNLNYLILRFLKNYYLFNKEISADRFYTLYYLYDIFMPKSPHTINNLDKFNLYMDNHNWLGIRGVYNIMIRELNSYLTNQLYK